MDKAYCSTCGMELKPAPAKHDGELTFVGYLPCNHDQSKDFAERWKCLKCNTVWPDTMYPCPQCNP